MLPRCSASPGGRVGRALANTLTDLFGPAGAFVMLVALAILGIIIGFGIPLRQLLHPVVGTARWAGATAAASMRRVPPDESGAVAVEPATNGRSARTNGKAVPAGPSPGQTGAWGDDETSIPAAVPSKGQTSNTFAPARGTAASATILAPVRPPRTSYDVADASDRRSPSTGSSTSCRRCRSSTTSRSRSMPAAMKPSTRATRRSSSRS